VIYIDDCLITSRDFEEHLSHIDQLLKSWKNIKGSYAC
jgi:hypothetical protein